MLLQKWRNKLASRISKNITNDFAATVEIERFEAKIGKSEELPTTI